MKTLMHLKDTGSGTTFTLCGLGMLNVSWVPATETRWFEWWYSYEKCPRCYNHPNLPLLLLENTAL